MPAVIFKGSLVKALKNSLSLNDSAYVLTGTADPTSVAQDAPQGSLYLRTGGSGGGIYSKQDAGSTTNWALLTSAGSGLSWNVVTGASQTLANNNGYIIDNAAEVDLTLPASASVGAEIAIVGYGAGGYRILQNSGQQILNLSDATLVGTSGELHVVDPTTSLHLVCVVANTTWALIKVHGELALLNSIGYLIGGSNNGTGSEYDTISKMVLSTEAIGNVVAVISQDREDTVGVSSKTRAYAMGGISVATANYDTIDYVQYSNDSSAALAAVLTTAGAVAASCQSKANGYAMGGNNTGGTNFTRIEALDLVAETTSVNAAVLSIALTQACGVTTDVKGYRVGGAGVAETNTIDIFNFATDLCAALTAVLASSKYAAAGMSTKLYGYSGGALDGGNALNSFERLHFPTESNMILTTTFMAVDKAFCTGITGSLKGYVNGGYPDSTLTTDTVYSLDFHNESTALVTDVLDQVTRSAAGASA